MMLKSWVVIACSAVIVIMGTNRCNRGYDGLTDMGGLAVSLAKKDTNIAGVVISKGYITEARKNQSGEISVKQSYIPPEGRQEIDILVGGGYSIRIKDKGFCISPGLYGGYVSQKMRLGVGCKMVYWKRLGVDLIAMPPIGNIIMAVSYAPPWRLRNTVVWCGVASSGGLGAGIAIRF